MLNRLRHSLAAAIIGVVALLAWGAAFADQSTIVIPSQGPETFGNVVTNRLNPAFRALLSNSSGNTAPANGPGAAPIAYQFWVDTSTTPGTLKVYDGSTWLALATIDATGHIIALPNAVLTGTPKTPALTGYVYANGSGGWTASANIPAASLSGTIQAAQFPTIGGDCSVTAGTLTTTCNSFGGGTAFGSAAGVNVGTSGVNLGRLNTNKTDSGNNTYTGTNNHSGTENFTGPISLPANSVTLGNLPQSSAAWQLFGNFSSTAVANPQYGSISQLLDNTIGATPGTIMCRGPSTWGPVTGGTSGNVLTSTGATSCPTYQAPGASTTLFPGMLYGLALAWAGTSTIANFSGVAASDDGASRINMNTTLFKTMGAWAAGGTGASPAGGLDVGSAVANGWYHVYLINNPAATTPSPDLLISLAPGQVSGNLISSAAISIASPAVITVSGHGLPANSPVVFSTNGALPTGITAGTIYYVMATNLAANTFQISATQGGAAINTSGSQSGAHAVASTPVMPSGYTVKRRIGSILNTATAGNITQFVQTGDDFIWYTPITQANNVSIALKTPTAVRVASPPGIKTKAFLGLGFNTSTANNSLQVYSPDGGGTPNSATSLATFTARTQQANAANTVAAYVLTDNLGNVIVYANDSAGTYYLGTTGYTDPRGKL